MQQQGNRGTIEHQPPDRQTASAHAVSPSRNQRWPQAREARDRRVPKRAEATMQPCDRLTAKEIQVAMLVWEGQTNREIANVIGTTEQVIKNYLRNTFDKLGVWSRLELALYVAAHGGTRWRDPVAAALAVQIAPSNPTAPVERAAAHIDPENQKSTESR